MEGGTRFNPNRRKIFIIKVVHSGVFLAVSSSILHIFWAGLLNRPSRITAMALLLSLGECAVFLLNRGKCPLTGMVETMGSENGRVSDIFLPRWFADRIPQIYTPPLVIGVSVLLLRRIRSGN